LTVVVALMICKLSATAHDFLENHAGNSRASRLLRGRNAHPTHYHSCAFMSLSIVKHFCRRGTLIRNRFAVVFAVSPLIEAGLTAVFSRVSRVFEEDQELRLCSANCTVCAASIYGPSPERRKPDSLRYTGGSLLFHTIYSFKRKLL